MSTDRTTASSVLPSFAACPVDEPVRGSGPLELIVTRVEALTPRIRRFELRSPRGGLLPPWTPGAHVSVPVTTAKGDEQRSYSLMGDCRVRDAYDIAVLRCDDESGGSGMIHREWRHGTRLRCGMPANQFGLDAGSDPVVLIAGGIGITPIRSMAIELARSGRSFALHYVARSPDEMALRQDLADQFGVQAHFWFSRVGDAARFDASSTLKQYGTRAAIYVCGPLRLIQAVVDAADGQGIPRERLRFERFAAALPQPGDRAIEVHLERSDKTVRVAADTSILDAVLAAGVDAKFGCRMGQCGACAVECRGGEPDHRDTALNDVDRTIFGMMCICVSRAKGERLVLDL